MSNAIVKALPTLPQDIDLIVAVPRSGLLPATLIALYLNLPLTDVNGLLERRLITSGIRPLRCGAVDVFETARTILVVDDCVGAGTQMRALREKLSVLKARHCLLFAVVYYTPEGRQFVDIACELLRRPQCFTWNMLHSNKLERACVALEGVLRLEAGDETGREVPGDEGPLIAPLFTIAHIVSRRRESEREEITAWLQRSGISYGCLHLLPAATEGSKEVEIKYKAAIYRQSGSWMFIENNFTDSRDLVAASKRPVICLATAGMLYPTQPHRMIQNLNLFLSAVFVHFRKRLGAFRRSLFRHTPANQ